MWLKVGWDEILTLSIFLFIWDAGFYTGPFNHAVISLYLHCHVYISSPFKKNGYLLCAEYCVLNTEYELEKNKTKKNICPLHLETLPSCGRGPSEKLPIEDSLLTGCQKINSSRGGQPLTRQFCHHLKHNTRETIKYLRIGERLQKATL